MSEWIKKLEERAKEIPQGEEGDLAGSGENFVVVAYDSKGTPDEISLEGDFTLDQLEDLIAHMKKFNSTKTNKGDWKEMKVKVCIPDLVPRCYIGVKEARSLKHKQGEIVEATEAENSFIWDSTAFPKEWFKVVEKTPYQEWAEDREIAAESPETTFTAGRESLKPILSRCLDFIAVGYGPKAWKEIMTTIEKELER